MQYNIRTPPRLLNGWMLLVADRTASPTWAIIYQLQRYIHLSVHARSLAKLVFEQHYPHQKKTMICDTDTNQIQRVLGDD